jgi:DNA-binding transcriptional regulator YiaG
MQSQCNYEARPQVAEDLVMDVVTSWTGARADALRQALRMTNEAFAERLGVAVRTVAYWRQRPGSVPQPAMQEALDTLLAQAPELARAQFRLIVTEREQGQASLAVTLTAASLWPTDDESPSGLARPGPPLLAAEGSTHAVSAGGTRLITPGDLVRVRSMRAHLKAIDNAHGGGAALPMATRYLHVEILPLLGGSDPDPTARSLVEATAEYEHDVGWMAYDAGQKDVAERYFASALRRARAVGNRLLAGRILAAMSHQAIHLGHFQQGIELAQASRRVTAHMATPRALAMEAAMEACAHAATGDARQCHRALDDAANAITFITADGQPDPDWLDFDEGGFWGHAARAYRDLGEMNRAEESVQKSVTLCMPGHSRTHAQRSTIRATAHLGSGELEAAIDAGEQVIRDAWSLYSAHVFGEVAQLAAAIAPFRTPAASDFVNQTRELLASRGQLAIARLAGCDHLESLGKPPPSQPRSRGVLSNTLPQPLRQRVRIPDLACVRPYTCDLAVERLSDVHVVVDVPLRAVDQPRLPDRPGLQSFLLPQADEGKPVTRIGVDRSQRGRARREMIWVRTAEPIPVPLRAPGHHPLRPHLPNHPDELFM